MRGPRLARCFWLFRLALRTGLTLGKVWPSPPCAVVPVAASLGANRRCGAVFRAEGQLRPGGSFRPALLHLSVTAYIVSPSTVGVIVLSGGMSYRQGCGVIQPSNYSTPFLPGAGRLFGFRDDSTRAGDGGPAHQLGKRHVRHFGGAVDQLAFGRAELDPDPGGVSAHRRHLRLW